jgi:glycine/D-amino acid oxidase-like deaminating enzyme
VSSFLFCAMLEKPYWQDTIAFPQQTQLQPQAVWLSQVDVAVVGGGYTGLAAARELALRGARVAVLEQQVFGWGASSRNGGQVLTGTKLSASALLNKYGKPVAQAMWRNAMQAIAYVENVVRAENITCGFRRYGHLELAWKPSHFEHYQHEAALLNEVFAHPVTLVPKQALHTEIGSSLYHGGLVDEASAGLNPAQYAIGLQQAAERAGAMLFAATTVQSIERDNGQYHINTSRGPLHARDVLVATNGYTGTATPSLQRKIVPVGSYIIATEPLPPDLAQALIPKRRMVFDSKNFLYYWRLSDDDRLIFGGRASFVPETQHTVRESAEILRAAMLRVHPQAAQARIDYAWGGTLGFTFDLLPHAGKTKEGWHYALGCGGHGVAMLSHLGACVAQRMLGERVDNPIFDLPTPGAPLGLYDGKPWFLPFVGWYYRLLDWLE